MSKELFISSSPHETKVAVLEDDQLVEVYHERDVDVGLVGGIYKGRVSRVLPGMQSAFVNIGLERDAFLYVSDFYEDEEEYDKVFTEAEARATRFVEGPAAPAAEASRTEAPVTAPAETAAEVPTQPAPTPLPAAPQAASESASIAPPPPQPPPRPAAETGGFRRQEHRGRRRRHGRDFGDRKFPPRSEPHDRPVEPSRFGAPSSFEILPGESLAKYRGVTPSAPSQETTVSGPPAADVAEPAPETAPLSEMGAATEPAASTVGTTAGVTGGESELHAAVPPSPPETSAESASAEVAPPPEPRLIAVPYGVAEPSSPEAPVAHEEEPVAEIESTHIGVSLPSFSPVPPEAAAPDLEATHVGIHLPALPQVEDETEPAEAAAAAEPAEPTEVFADGRESGPELLPEAPAAEMDETDLSESDATGPQAEALADGDVAPHDEAGAEPAAPEAVSGETPAEPTEKKVTLREPSQRPRFAPRRRRGRRGMGPRPRTEPRHEASRPGNYQPVQISDLLKEGQEIIVQIAKEPLGTKGARITSHIALPGRYLVYMPTISHIGVSRKISSEDERLRLRNIILENKGSLTGGFIVRTAGSGRSEEELKADLKFLSTLWNDIKTKAERTKAPALLHRDLDLVQRILRDTLSPDFKTIRVDNEVEYERCVEFVNRCQPSLVGHIKLYTKDTPLFEEFGIQAEIDKALKPKVWLKSGGYIVINQTEALVAIDVNTGKYVGKTNRLEDTIVKTNIDAVNEIVRQIRLRDLGGILVIDFIDMDERRNRQKVVQALEEALRRDRAPTKIISFNDFGLVAITRKRVKQSLERTLCQPCSYCSGSGWVKSVASVCYEILGEVKKMAKHLEGDTITLRVNPDVAQALKSRQAALLSEIESLTHKDVIIKSDPLVHQERFEIY